MTEVDYTDDLALLPNTAAQALYLLHSLEQAERSIGFYVNANKTVHKSIFNKNDFSFKWQTSKIRTPVNIPRQQYLLYWKQYQYT